MRRLRRLGETLRYYNPAISIQPGEEAALWTRFSREVEHDEDNLAQLIWVLSEPNALPPPLTI